MIDQPGQSRARRSLLAEVGLADPEPAGDDRGAPLPLRHRLQLRDTATLSCGTCHLFGDMDKLAWDLGATPSGRSSPTRIPMVIFLGGDVSFHPLKGPMTTQSLRGLPGAGPTALAG